jgi:ribosomal protein S18 acetylase RimI-like enzyme
MEIRELGETDAAAFRALRLRALGECPAAFASSYEEECQLSPEQWQQRVMPSARRATFGAFADQQLVGITVVRREQRRKLEHRANILSVYVSPECRARGIARELLNAAICRAFAMPGVLQLQLTVNAANAPAIRLYRSAGFRQIGIDPRNMLVDGVLHDERRFMLEREAATHTDWALKDLDDTLVDLLTHRLASSELSALLIRVMSARAADREPAKLLQQWQRDRFVAPTMVDPHAQLALDQILFAEARGFEAIELSPLAPLGTCSAVASSSQNRIVTTIRGSEVVSDPTNVMALESARRLRADSTRTVRLAASHRCVRAQSFPAGPGMAAHFRLFCLTSAGHEIEDHGFVVGALIEHIRFHLHAIGRIRGQEQPATGLVLRLLAVPSRAHLLSRIANAVSTADLRIEQGELISNYYDGLRFKIDVAGPSGEPINLCDGGAFDWVARLTANRKMVFVTSAMGSQRAAVLFAAQSKWRS